MNQETKTIKLTFLKGELPGYGTEWWNEEDWNKYDTYVKELKDKGEYLKEEVVIINYTPYPQITAPDNRFNNFGILIPDKNELL